MYPEDACREALINAIAHRDYSIEGRGIEILIFDDRMEVHSPGGLLSTVRIEELKRLQGLHQSRNALVARTLREIGYMREMGEGLRRIYKLMSDADLVAPDLRSDLSKFSIILSHKSVFSDSDQRWLDGFRSMRLTREEMLVALLGRDGQLLSAQKIYNTLGLVDWDVYRVIVDQMQSKGVLFNTRPKTQARLRTTQKRRDVPRFAIRQPDEVERGVSELLAVCGRVPMVAALSTDTFRLILVSLPKNSIYRANIPQLVKVLRVLNLIDESASPTELLRGIWKARAADLDVAPAEAAKSGEARPVVVRPLPSRPLRGAPRAGSRPLYIGNLPYDATNAELKELFAVCGEVVSVEIPVDHFSRRGRGFAFVRMATDRDAATVLQQLDGRLFGGRQLRISWSGKYGDIQRGRDGIADESSTI